MTASSRAKSRDPVYGAACHRAARAGFTLIELLVVAALLGLVIAAIGACIGGGLRVWDTARTVSEEQATMMLAFALLDRDLTGTFPFYGIPFKGEARELAFPTVVRRTAQNPSGVGEARYGWDSLARTLVREEREFPGLANARPEVEPILADVTGFSVEYGRVSATGSGVFEWRSEWSDPTNHPHAVRITVDSGNRDRAVRFEKLVRLPLGGEPYGGG